MRILLWIIFHKNIQTHTQTRTHTHAQTNTPTHKHTNTQTHKHTNTPTPPLKPPQRPSLHNQQVSNPHINSLRKRTPRFLHPCGSSMSLCSHSNDTERGSSSKLVKLRLNAWLQETECWRTLAASKPAVESQGTWLVSKLSQSGFLKKLIIRVQTHRRVDGHRSKRKHRAAAKALTLRIGTRSFPFCGPRTVW